MEQKKKWKTWHKVTIGLIGAFILLGIIAVATTEDEPDAQAKPEAHLIKDFISARQLKIDLENEGFNFLPAIDLDSMYRLSAEGTEGPLMFFYKEDTVTRGSATQFIKDDRDNLDGHLSRLGKFLHAIDPEAEKWILDTIKQHPSGKELEATKEINKGFFGISYFPDVESDMLQVTYYLKDPNQ